jgi:hypothetical protein
MVRTFPNWWTIWGRRKIGCIHRHTASIKNFNDRDALEAALVAAMDYRQHSPTKLKLHDDQGCNALTFLAKYADDSVSTIQLRDSPIDVTIVQLARKLLGAIVPNVVNVTATQTAYAYGQPRIPGGRWDLLIFLARGRGCSGC